MDINPRPRWCRSRYPIMVFAATLCLCPILQTAFGAASGGHNTKNRYNNNDPYTVLGVSNLASRDEIKKIYRKLCLRYHPDKNVQKPERERKFSEMKFKQVQEAYGIILRQQQNRRQPRHTGYSNEILYFLLRPGRFLSELRRANLYALGTPFAKRCSTNSNSNYFRSVYLQKVQVPLEDLYKGVPSFCFDLKDDLIRRYQASIRGNFFCYSLYQASIFFVPLLSSSKAVFALLAALYIVNGTTPIPDPTASYTTTIRRGAKGGATTVRFEDWDTLEVVFRIEEAEHPVYRRIGNDLHASLTLSGQEAVHGCTKRLPALDPKTEPAIEIKIPAKKYSYEQQQQHQNQQKQRRHRHQRRKRRWWKKRSQDKGSEAEDNRETKSYFSDYDNTIRVAGRGWPIRTIQSDGNDPDVYLHGDLIVAVNVAEPSSSSSSSSSSDAREHGLRSTKGRSRQHGNVSHLYI